MVKPMAKTVHGTKIQLNQIIMLLFFMLIENGICCGVDQLYLIVVYQYIQFQILLYFFLVIYIGNFNSNFSNTLIF